ncbi:hypothetical protein FOL47_003225 [Perkinsus chesapeaki]|uniref:Uncharacterized protein n=1 Tax=Perkinsus chesapeaki TaxID=330153 RepID=A0A7J6KNB1_PERCH|nr:hypothetical protein FOL47_003225 [Perkinsus chesapeaki]
MASYGSQPYSMSTYAPQQQQADVGQLMSDMTELFPKLTPEYQSQAREAHQHVLQLQRQGMTNEAISLLEHMRNQMRQMVETGLTPGRVPAVPESPIPSSEEGGGEERMDDSPAPAAVASRTSVGADPSPVHQPRRSARSRRTNLPDGAVHPSASTAYQQAGQSQPELSLDNGPFGTPPLGGAQPDFAAGGPTVPATAPSLQRDPKDADVPIDVVGE